MGVFSTKADGVTCPGHDRMADIRARMPRPASLPPGRTPWDGLPREDLVFLLASMHSALADAAHLVRQGPGLGSASDRAAVAAVGAALGHVHPDYLGEPVDVHVAYGRGRAEHGGPTDAEAIDARLGIFRDLLAFSSPSLDWWACLNCHQGQGRKPHDRPVPLADRCAGGSACDWRRASWEVVRRLAGVGADG